MTFSTDAQLAFALTALQGRQPIAFDPVPRLCLLLVSLRMKLGAVVVGLDELHRQAGTDDPSEIADALRSLSRLGLLRVSDAHHLDHFFVASSLATDEQIAHARDALGCNWPFRRWTGET